MTPECPFCHPSCDRLFYEGVLVRALWDSFPISPGHALIVPRRHVAGLFDCSPAELAELIGILATVRGKILERHAPDGFNVGVNVGEAAGQTVFHVHIHVIPRYAGDVPDPRGGVRHIIPGKARYWEAP
jgi:diadenosine tetraphosphate (Ap4A) HIT family hydrolase